MAEEIDDELKQIEEEIKQLENNPSGTTSPAFSEKAKDTLINLAREMILSDDTKKFANLDHKYIGFPTVPINSKMEIAAYCDIEGMSELGNYFRKEAEIHLATSLSINGTFLKLLVTQIKKEEKSPETSEKKQKSWSLFKKNNGIEG